MAITELPTKRSDAENYNPSMVVFFGKPKSGKSTLMASLEDNLMRLFGSERLISIR